MEADSRASVHDREGGEAAVGSHVKSGCPDQPKAFDHKLATRAINEIDSDLGKE
jgi:hypothetical protein